MHIVKVQHGNLIWAVHTHTHVRGRSVVKAVPSWRYRRVHEDGEHDCWGRESEQERTTSTQPGFLLSRFGDKKGKTESKMDPQLPQKGISEGMVIP